jgi:hypothetical protein
LVVVNSAGMGKTSLLGHLVVPVYGVPRI